jgi:hypothetical protein
MGSEIPSKRQRNRPTKACKPCRARKVKCDMQQPCRTCAKRDRIFLCCYETIPNQTPSNSHSITTPPNGHSDSSTIIPDHEHNLNTLLNPDAASLGSIDGGSLGFAEVTSHNVTPTLNDQIIVLADLATHLSPLHSESDETTEVVHIGQNASAAFFWSLGDFSGSQGMSQLGAARIASAFCLTNRTILHPFGSLWAPRERETLLQLLATLPRTGFCVK